MKKGSSRDVIAKNANFSNSNHTNVNSSNNIAENTVNQLNSNSKNFISKNDELTNKFEICVSTMKNIENLNNKQYQYLQKQGDQNLLQSYSQQANLFKKMFENLTNFLIFSATNIDSNISNISNDVSSINFSMSNCKESMDQNLIAVDNLNDTILDLKETINNNKETIENLMHLNKCLQKQIKSQTALINALQSENSNLISQIKSFQVSNENLICQIQSFNKTIQESNEIQANYKESIIVHLQEIFIEKFSSKYIKRTVTKNVLNEIVVDIKNILGY